MSCHTDAWPAALLALLLLAAPAAAQRGVTAGGDAARGEAFARQNCAACHAIGRSGASPRREAPRFRDLHRRYPVEQLAEALAEGIGTGHEEMPEFQLDPPAIADVLAWLRGLER
jgi:mono/diheme cytochrome c family protein